VPPPEHWLLDSQLHLPDVTPVHVLLPVVQLAEAAHVAVPQVPATCPLHVPPPVQFAVVSHAHLPETAPLHTPLPAVHVAFEAQVCAEHEPAT
jgi:hypothetical protein